MMYTLLIFLWWIGICQAKYVPGGEVACLDQHTWRMPDWDLPTNGFIEKFTERNRPWRHPLIQELVDNQILPADVVLPEPLLPTNNSNLLKLYNEAIRVFIIDNATSDKDKELSKDRFDQDRACRAYGVECQTASWMQSWPFWSCATPEKTGAFAQAQKSRALDNLTLSLLKRAHKYALLNLAHRLISIVKELPIRKNGNLTSPLYRRVYSEADEPLPHIGIPKFAIHVESLVRFYTNPKHRAEHQDVRQPHLPDHFVPPSPLLSTLSEEVNKADINKVKLAKLYKDALKAYDEDSKLSERQLRRRWNQNLDDSWEWIVADPCYYDRTACNIYDNLSRIFSSGFFKNHEEQGKALKKTMQHIGLARLGLHLILEAVKNKGTRSSLEQLLNRY